MAVEAKREGWKTGKHFQKTIKGLTISTMMTL